MVTGTEVLTGRISDRNGPWLADRLLELGIELAHITICGDRPEDIEAQLRFMADQGLDLVVTSGGLGPTADDMTVEVVARFAGRPLVLHEKLEARIAEILRGLMRRFQSRSFEAVRAANRKQALVPEGAHVIYPVGTAPGLVVPGKPVVVVLPGPPRELQPMWAEATETEIFREATAGRVAYEQSTMRLFGLPESSMAETLRVAEDELEGFDRLEITTCLRRAEVEVVTRYEAGDAGLYEGLTGLIEERHARELFSRDGSLVDEQVIALLDGRTVATAESCTAGLLAARLTERPGSSAWFTGGVVAYANEAKAEVLGVDAALIEAHGAVSPEVAAAMAQGALQRFGSRRRRGRDRRGRPGRRHRGEARRHRVLLRRHRRRGRARAGRAAPRVACRHPRPLHHRGDASAAAAAERGGGRVAPSDTRMRLFVALDLPPGTRAALGAWRDELLGARRGPAPRPGGPASRHARLSRLVRPGRGGGHRSGGAGRRDRGVRSRDGRRRRGPQATPVRPGAPRRVGCGHGGPGRRGHGPRGDGGIPARGTSVLAPRDPRPSARQRSPGAAERWPAAPADPVVGTAITLYRSLLRPSGAVYEALDRRSLGGGS